MLLSVVPADSPRLQQGLRNLITHGKTLDIVVRVRGLEGSTRPVQLIGRLETSIRTDSELIWGVSRSL